MRRHIVGFIALCVALGGTAYAANTVRSTDIVDGQVKTEDLAKGAVTADKLSGLGHFEWTVRDQTDQCTEVQTWLPCTRYYRVTVPAGHTYVITVTSTINADANQTSAALFCPATSGPTCMASGPEWVTFQPKSLTSATSTVTKTYSAGTYYFTTAVKLLAPIVADGYAHTTMHISLFDVRAVVVVGGSAPGYARFSLTTTSRRGIAAASSYSAARARKPGGGAGSSIFVIIRPSSASAFT